MLPRGKLLSILKGGPKGSKDLLLRAIYTKGL